MVPSDEEDEAMETDEDDSDKSKENVDANISGRKGSRKNSKGSNEEPKKKRRRIILHSDSESGDDYKPENDAESEDGSASSGGMRMMYQNLRTESEIDSPVKYPKTPSSTPKISQGTKSKLSLFAAKEKV
ncbi:uncharacterized protein LOC134788748 [Penaeus indicus]|uniref:uncharacterized protein LOC134788748 n=1 Tax=Penaeus indicus TaxID=29960 RepID=UPI00300D73F3